MPNSNEEPLPPAGEAAPTPASTPVDSVSEVNDQLASTKLSDQDESRPLADAAVGDTNPKEDPDLWKPYPPTEDCPVCMVPMPVENDKIIYWACCGKMLCVACCHEHDRALNVTNRKRDKKKQPPLEKTCAFCRRPHAENDTDLIRRYEERIEKGDTQAMINLALKYKDGKNGLRKNDAKGAELLNRAADLGSADEKLRCWTSAERFSLSPRGTKAMEYFENAATKGYVRSRCNLAIILAKEGNYDLAIKHWHLAAAAGDDDSMKRLWNCFSMGKLSKPDLLKSLRAHKPASDEMKSEERERYDAAKEARAGNDELLKHTYGSYYFGYINAKELKKALKAHAAGDWRAVETFLANKIRTNR